MACPGSFPSSHGESHPDPMLGRDLDPDKPGCTMSGQVDETDPTFLHLFFWNWVRDF